MTPHGVSAVVLYKRQRAYPSGRAERCRPIPSLEPWCGRRTRMRERILLGDLSTQDVDLLGRLTIYFDTLEDRLRQGQGWLIFNSGSDRGARIVAFILGRLNEYRPYFSYYHLPWRDFALHAYVSTVELPKDAPLLEQDRSEERRVGQE